jgi:hypothetical protein
MRGFSQNITVARRGPNCWSVFQRGQICCFMHKEIIANAVNSEKRKVGVSEEQFDVLT